MITCRARAAVAFLTFLAIACLVNVAPAQVLDKRAQLEAQTFWDNRDWDWYIENIPFFECPDADITTTYYYRWELLTKHLTYGSPNSGYSFTEFIDRPFWSGAYGAISCPAGHQLYEARWLRNPRFAHDYLRYWFHTPGAEPRRYSNWIADAAFALHEVHPDKRFTVGLLPDLIKNYDGWVERHYVPEVGLFWQTGHDDGMEYNINSRQTRDLVRGSPGFRPSFNAYMWSEAKAIASIARLAGDRDTWYAYDEKANKIRDKMLELLWDDKRQFFFHVNMNEEERDGHVVKALSKTYETGQYAGDPHGRELIGYVPWQFHMIAPDSKYDQAWAKLMDRDGFYADYGPTTVERNDPMFLLQDTCCWWSGQSWPYGTAQTLKALANRLQRGPSQHVTRDDYLKLLNIYARSHRKDGRPYLAEALNPDTGSFEGHDSYNHSEHYFHSSFCDLVITGLVGLIPQDDEAIKLSPLAPEHWDYFCLDDIPYHGHRVSIVWDKHGTRYKFGPGAHIVLDGGKMVTSTDTLDGLTGTWRLSYNDRNDPRKPPAQLEEGDTTPVNFAVNNDGDYYPSISATYTSGKTSLGKLIDGNYWYHLHPPNRWTCEGSPSEADEIVIDFGMPRTFHTIKLYPLDDFGVPQSTIRTPRRIELETWRDDAWHSLAAVNEPAGHRANVVKFAPLATSKLRVRLHHAADGKSGLSEIEAWGDAVLPVAAAPAPPGNLAQGATASASFTDRVGGKPEFAVDGKTLFVPAPMNRWTAYESPNSNDWLELDFGREIEFRRLGLAIYNDGGGVQAPESYAVELWTGDAWAPVKNANYTPEQPRGDQWNEVRFDPMKATRLRIVFQHRGAARSGVSEVMVWND